MSKIIKLIMSLFELDARKFIKKLRLAGGDYHKLVEETLIGIRREIQSTDPTAIENGLIKLINIYLLGYNIDWAAFGMISLIGSTKYKFKRLGYLSISLIINSNKQLNSLLLNSINKDMNSMNLYIIQVAMNALSYTIDEELVTYIVKGVSNLLVSSHPQIKKRALILLFKCIKLSPILSIEYEDKITNALNDNNYSTQTTAIIILTEMATQPAFITSQMKRSLFSLFQNVVNNIWMLIKIIKIFNQINLESKLLRNIEDRMVVICQGTSAFSLLFECLFFIAKNSHRNTKMIEICVEKLNYFLLHNDGNFQYMSLKVIKILLKERRDIVISLKNNIATLLYSDDLIIRYDAIEIFAELVNKGNIKSIVKMLSEMVKKHKTVQVDDYEFIKILILKITTICSQDNYDLISNFEWYIDVLLDLMVTEIQSTIDYTDSAIGSELLVISLRVQAIREYLIDKLEKIIINMQESKLLNHHSYSTLIKTIVWIVSEYINFVHDPLHLLHQLQQSWVLMLNQEALAVVVHSIIKIISYLFIYHSDHNRIVEETRKVVAFFDQNSNTDKMQTLERTQTYKLILEIIIEDDKNELYKHLNYLFQPEIKQVTIDAQKNVTLSHDIDLSVWINPNLEPKYKIKIEADSVKKSLSAKKTKKSHSNIKKKHKKHYPVTSYIIAPLETGETEIKSEISQEKDSNDISTKKSTGKKKMVKNVSKDDDVIPISIDSFLKSSTCKKFKTNWDETMKRSNSSLDDILKAISIQFNVKIMDQNENTFLVQIHIDDFNIFLMIDCEKESIKLYIKSHISTISSTFIESIKNIINTS